MLVEGNEVSSVYNLLTDLVTVSDEVVTCIAARTVFSSSD